VIVCGSSERQLSPAGSVDLVLTDPPYFDDVQYAELGGLFLVWARATGLIDRSVAVDLQREAVPNSIRGTTAEDYERILCRILCETRRTLRDDGRLLLTFHNSDLHAWSALAKSLNYAGFGVKALAVADSENGTDHAKRNVRSFTKDLVLECVVGPAREPIIVTSSDDSQDRELIAAGRAVAVAGDLTFSEFETRFRDFSVGLEERRIRDGVATFQRAAAANSS
jgi:adenine-specific DNA methylase